MTPQQNKNFKIGAAIAGGLLIIYLLTKSGADNSSTGIDPTGNGDTTNPGTAPFNAKKIADRLLEAMRYSGTDEEEIQDALRTVTQAQFALVIKAFGKPQYNETLGNEQNPTAWFDELPYRDLAFWLKNELATSTYATLRLKYPKYL